MKIKICFLTLLLLSVCLLAACKSQSGNPSNLNSGKEAVSAIASDGSNTSNSVTSGGTTNDKTSSVAIGDMPVQNQPDNGGDEVNPDFDNTSSSTGSKASSGSSSAVSSDNKPLGSNPIDNNSNWEDFQ